MDVKEFKIQVMTYSRRIKETMNCTIGPACSHLGLTLLQLQLVMELYQEGAHTIGSLADSMHMAKANMSTMCKKMEKMGLLERTRDRDDERVVKVILTEEGNRIAAKIDDQLLDTISRAASMEDERIFDDILRGLEKLTLLIERIMEIEEKERNEKADESE